MAVRRLGQSVTDLLRQCTTIPPVIRLCNVQQRGFADAPEQTDVNGIPVEVCTYTVAHLHGWQCGHAHSDIISIPKLLHREYAVVAPSLPSQCVACRSLETCVTAGAHSNWRTQISCCCDQRFAWRQMASDVAEVRLSSGHLQALRYNSEPRHYKNFDGC